MATETKAEAAKAKQTTEYVVLRKVSVTDEPEAAALIEAAAGSLSGRTFYEVVDTGVHATGNDPACRAQAKATGPGVYVASPTSSFKPLRLDVENDPRVVLVGTEPIL